MVKYYELRPGASSTQYKKVEDIISNYGKGEKDQYFDCRKFSNALQQARSAYELIFDLTSGPREIIKPVQETAKQLLQQIVRTDARMIEFAINLEQTIEQSPAECTMESVMKAIVERQSRINDAMGPAKCTLQMDKQGDSKDGKKKGDKSATANPAFKDGIAGSLKCQLCSLDHSATDCPTFQELRKQSATKRGELLPGKSDKDGKRKGAKGSQNLDAAEDSGDKFCLVCSQLKDIPDWAARNHSTRECGQIARLSKYREDGGQTENPNRYR